MRERPLGKIAGVAAFAGPVAKAGTKPVQRRDAPRRITDGSPQQASGTPVGSALWVERRYAGKVASAAVRTWKDFPLQLANAKGPAVDFQQVRTRAQLDQLSETNKATDEQGAQWWGIEVLEYAYLSVSSAPNQKTRLTLAIVCMGNGDTLTIFMAQVNHIQRSLLNCTKQTIMESRGATAI